MKAKYLIIVSLMLAIITIGVVSASEDVMTDELTTGDVTEDPIEEVSVDDVIEESENSESLGDVAPQDFNVQIKDSVNLTDGDDVAIKYTYPDSADGYVQVFIGDDKDLAYSESMAPGIYNITLDELGISKSGTYSVEVNYFDYGGSTLKLANGTLNVVITYDKDDFEISWTSYVTDDEDYVLDVWNFPTEGTLVVSVNGQKRFNKTVTDPDMDDIYVYLPNLNITSDGTYTVSAKYVTADSQEIDLGSKSVTVDLDGTPSGEDEIYVKLYSYLDVKNPKDSMGYVENYDGYLNGTVIVTINGKQYLSKKITSGYRYEITTADLNLLNAAFGRYLVNITYVSANGDKYSDQGYVNFTTVPSVYVPYKMSVGENTAIIISGDSSVSGTYTVYNAVWDDKNDEYKRTSVFQAGKITNGYASISLQKLSEGTHIFLIDYTFGTYSYVADEYDCEYVYVENNTQGFSSTISTATITAGGTVTVKLTGPKSDSFASIYIDGKSYKEVKFINGEISESVSGLSAGTHYITVKFDDGSSFYSNTYVVTVNGKPVNPPAPVIKLTLKKVKVKKSAKKLTLTATLKIDGKAAKGKVLTFKFNKKTLKAKTNKKGVAKVKIGKKVLKKLKVGKKVAYQVSYGKTVKKLTVKVKK